MKSDSGQRERHLDNEDSGDSGDCWEGVEESPDSMFVESAQTEAREIAQQ